MESDTPKPTGARDGIVSGTAADDRIDAAYTGDPDGDMIDNSDAIIPGEAPEDDIVMAGGGNDFVTSLQCDDEVHGGDGNDTCTRMDSPPPAETGEAAPVGL